MIASDLAGGLHQVFGFPEFRPLQREAVEAALSGRDVLVVMPTGAGKSLTFQLPAALDEGVTLVISPLIALMRDQVTALRERTAFADLGAAFLNSSQSSEEQRELLREMRAGRLKLLYVAPERLRSTFFLEALASVRVARFVVDEAHCISEWGHDFRPDYLTIGSAIDALGRPPLLAVTATATRRVQASIIHNLGMRDPAVFSGGFDRPNLHFGAVRCGNDHERAERLLKAIPKLIARGGSGLVYCPTRRQCEQVGAVVASALKPLGLRAGVYHAGLPSDERSRVQSAWLCGEAAVLVATNAFGMGVDKPDVRFVVHWGPPESVESYYQEAGRAGRDGRRSRCTILTVTQGDRKLREFFLQNEEIQMDDLHRVVRKISSLGEGAVTLSRGWWERELEWREPRPRVVLGKLEGAGVIERIGESAEGLSVRLLAPRIPPQIARKLDAALTQENEIRRTRLAEMLAYVKTSTCRREAILAYFGEEMSATPAPCCDNCDHGPRTTLTVTLATGRVPPPLRISDLHELIQGIDSLVPALGRSRLSRLLRGSRAQNVERFAAHPLNGCLARVSAERAVRVLDDLLVAGLIVQTVDEEYSVIRVTEKGRKAWETREELGIEWPLGREKRPAPGAKTPPAAAQSPADLEVDPAVMARFAGLRAWRRERAAEEKVPPYCVFPDRALAAIAEANPATPEALSEISGVGPARLEKYGEDVLRVLGATGPAE